MRVLHVGFGFRPLRWGGLIMYVEDLMDAEVAHGHEVGYFHAGRAYPFLPRPRLRATERDGIRRWEVVNPPVVVGGGYGTAYPAAELDEPVADAMFARVLREFGPDVVHVHEMLGLPTSIWSVARREGVPIMATIQDYGLLCPTLKLYDASGSICDRQRPGTMCVECCRHAPLTQQGLMDDSVFYEQARLLDRSGLHRIPRPARAVAAVKRANVRVLDRIRGDASPSQAADERVENPHATPAAYDERRAVNVARLSELDLVAAMSSRVAEILRERGVAADRVRHVQTTLTHIDRIPPRRIDAIDGPVRFVTLASVASREKGTDVVLDALRRLTAMGLGPDDYRLSIYGFVEDRARAGLDAAPAACWEGFYGPEDMARILATEHVGIVPSVWEECYGYVGVEMLAAGLPVIGNAVGGITDYVVDGRTGWRNEALDGEGLAAIMAGLIRDPARVLEANRRVLDHRGEYVLSMDDHVAELEGLYGGLAAQGAGAAA